MNALLNWAVSAGALYLTVLILQQFNLASAAKNNQWFGWFVAVVVMALVNGLIRPIVRLLTAPMNCLTFGLVGVLVNGLMFWLVPLLLNAIGIPVFSVTFLGAVVGAILVGGISGVAGSILLKKNKED